jgi:hypothetical protein
MLDEMLRLGFKTCASTRCKSELVYLKGASALAQEPNKRARVSTLLNSLDSRFANILNLICVLGE